MSMLCLCYDGGRRGTCSGVRDGRPFVHKYMTTVAYLDG